MNLVYTEIEDDYELLVAPVEKQGHVNGIKDFSLEFKLFRPHTYAWQWEYEVTLIGDDVYDCWDSYTEIFNGIQYLTLEKATQAILDIAEEVNNGNAGDYFSLEGDS